MSEATSADIVDVRHLPYMPLQIERLRRSKAWLRCKRRPELAFYILNLWMRSWHELPAGSIENDDDVLADAAMCPPDVWLQVRDDVLAGWKQDGNRLYHSTVTELAAEAGLKIKANRMRTEAARQAREQARKDAAEQKKDPITSTTSSVTETVTGPEGKGREGKEEVTQVRTVETNRTVVGRDKRAATPKDENSRGTFLPDDFEPEPTRWERTVSELGQERAHRELQRFKNHFGAKAGPEARKRNWQKTWDNWAMRAAEDGKRNPTLFGRPAARSEPRQVGATAVRTALDGYLAERGLEGPRRQPDVGARTTDSRVVDADWSAASGNRGNVLAIRAG